MKVNKWITGAIVAAFVLCLLAVAAVLIQQQSPDQHGSTGPLSGIKDTKDSGTVTPSPAVEVNGRVTDKYGNGLSGITVTLHLMGCDYINGNVSSVREEDTLTTPTDASGEYLFSSVILSPGVDYYYMSAKKDIPGVGPTYSNSLNFTLKNGTSITSNMVLYMPT
jgi:hypothetical protein